MNEVFQPQIAVEQNKFHEARTRHNTLVIGAGQAGISTSFFLKQKGIDHVVLERDRPFSAWHNRWDGFYANTPNWMNTLPREGAKKYPGEDRGGFATKEQLVDYFDEYCDEVGAPVISNQNIVELKQDLGGLWTARTSEGRVFEAENVIVCTGAMSKPRIPEFAESISPNTVQMHSQDYRRPSDITTKNVLIVGSGSSGVQICKELLDANHFNEVHLATSDVMVLPDHVLGLQIHRVLHLFGLFDVKVNSLLGRIMYRNLEFKGDPIRPPTPKELGRSHGLFVHERLTGAKGDELIFENGDNLKSHDLTVIWSTGFMGDYGWIRTAGSPLEFDDRDYPVHSRGVVEAHPGLFFVGLRYQHTVASHDIYGVGNDARFIVGKIVERCDEAAYGSSENTQPAV